VTLRSQAITLSLLAAAFALGGCASPTPAPTSTPTQTSTPTRAPTMTPYPPPTRRPTGSPTPTPTPPPTPSGKPLSKFRGIPVMPGALAGEANGDRAYMYIIKTDVAAVVEYYTSALPRYGFKGVGSGLNDNGGAVIYFSSKAMPLVNIFIDPQSDWLRVLIFIW
jgi:hypothetical protein